MVGAIGSEIKKTIHDYSRMFLIEGIIFIILGSAAIIVPPIASIGVAIFLGWLFLFGGIISLVSTFSSRGAPGFVWALVSSIIMIAAGIALVGWPVSGTISLTLVLSAFLFADGFFMIMFGIEHRRLLSKRWG